jgi:hypothetical protein
MLVGPRDFSSTFTDHGVSVWGIFGDYINGPKKVLGSLSFHSTFTMASIVLKGSGQKVCDHPSDPLIIADRSRYDRCPWLGEFTALEQVFYDRSHRSLQLRSLEGTSASILYHVCLIYISSFRSPSRLVPMYVFFQVEEIAADLE